MDLGAMFVHPAQLGDKRLAESRDSDGIFERRWHVADAKLDGIEKRVGSDIPPDTFAVVDASRFDQALYIIVEIAPGREYFRDAAAWEGLPDNGAV